MNEQHPHSVLIRDKGLTSDDNEVHMLEGDDVKQAKVEMWIAKTLGTELVRHYPTRMWSVKADITAGVVVIKLPEVSQQAGYVLSLQRSLTELEGMMLKVGGEILERGQLARARYHDSDDANALPRDFKDDVVLPDIEAPEEEAARKNKEAESARVQAIGAKAVDELRRGS